MNRKNNLLNLQDYFEEDITNVINNLNNINEEYLKQQSEKNVLENFKYYAPKIKAYTKILEKNSININNINNIDDFKNLPIMTKDNYITKYKWEDLVTNIADITGITSSSGSTGHPFYWAKGLDKDIDIAKKYELLFEMNFGIKDKKTLCIIALGLGVWNAGNVTIASAQLISEKGYDFSFITPGISIEENIKILDKFIDSDYDQFILIAYPSFIKDILEDAKNQNINITQKNIYILTGGETITEEWRDYIYHLLGKKNDNKRIISLMSTSESGVIAIETEFTNFIKKNLSFNKNLLNKLFNTDSVPTLVQYDPMSKYLESVDNSIVLSTYGVFPLIRYNTNDIGGIIGKSELQNYFSDLGININKSIKLPILYIKGRSDIALTLYAVNIYINNIKDITYSKALLPYITGRFQTYIEHDDHQNQIFTIKLESNRNINLSNKNKIFIKEFIINNLRKINSEYNKLYESVGEKAEPIIVIEKYNTENLFSHDKPKYKKIT